MINPFKCKNFSFISLLNKYIGVLSKKCSAFTLAEVLITLGVIGIVAAMTMPTLITNYQKRQTVTRLKSAYAQLLQAIKLSEVDNGDYAGWDYSRRDFFDIYLKNYMKVDKNLFIKSSEKISIQYKQISGVRETGLDLIRHAYGESNIYTLLNGVDIIAGGAAFIIDINGARTKPNQFGKDAFYFHMAQNSDRRLVPLGFVSTSECKVPNETPTRDFLKNNGCLQYACNRRSRGMWCGALIMLDGWEIAPDYPW